jgi:hypothetical protein
MLELEGRMSYRMTEPDDIDDLDMFAGMTAVDEQETITMELREVLRLYFKFADVEDLMRLVINEVL